MLVGLGYGYLFLVFTLSLATVLGLLALVIAAPNAATIKLGLVVGILAGGICFGILKGVWVRLPPPEGVEINESDAPELFALIQEIQTRLNVDLHGIDHVQPELNRILELDPKHASAPLMKAQYQLKEGNAEGIKLAEKAIENDSALTMPGLDLMHGFYAREGRKPEMNSIEDKMEKFSITQQMAEDERNYVSAKDTFLPHGLDETTIQNLIDKASKHDPVTQIIVVQKEVKHFTQHPLSILALTIKVPFLSSKPQTHQKIFDQFLEEVELKGNYLALVNEEDNRPICKAMQKAVTGAVIWKRPKK